jgi:hypothetical protein
MTFLDVVLSVAAGALLAVVMLALAGHTIVF